METLTKIGAFEAKTRFSELLEQVSRGAEITITRHDKPVARLVPFEKPSRVELQELFRQMDLFRSKYPLNPKGEWTNSRIATSSKAGASDEPSGHRRVYRVELDTSRSGRPGRPGGPR